MSDPGTGPADLEEAATQLRNARDDDEEMALHPGFDGSFDRRAAMNDRRIMIGMGLIRIAEMKRTDHARPEQEPHP